MAPLDGFHSSSSGVFEFVAHLFELIYENILPQLGDVHGHMSGNAKHTQASGENEPQIKPKVCVVDVPYIEYLLLAGEVYVGVRLQLT